MVDENGAHLLSIIASYLRKCGFTRTIGTLLDESEGKISNEMGEVDLESLYTFYTSMQANGTSKKKKRKTEHADKLPKRVINSIGELNEENKQSLAASVEPTGALAFRRVDIEKVAFSDPRLKNNSYWAKDGAEDGYGAKAQEVLGLVRGRDFRHEKTKKKRGTYKGGSIDFQSYSIKFENSDEE